MANQNDENVSIKRVEEMFISFAEMKNKQTVMVGSLQSLTRKRNEIQRNVADQEKLLIKINKEIPDATSENASALLKQIEKINAKVAQLSQKLNILNEKIAEMEAARISWNCKILELNSEVALVYKIIFQICELFESAHSENEIIQTVN